MGQGDVCRAEPLFPAAGEMAEAMRLKEWGATTLGPLALWPAELRTAVSICLHSNAALAVAWGRELINLYNDAAIPIFAARHPSALGRRVAEVLPEAWATIGPMLESVLDSGSPTGSEDLLLVLERGDVPEECYFTFSYSAIRTADGAIGGVFVTMQDTSARVLAERRQRTLADLALQVARRFGARDPLELLRQALARNPHDLPLTALYVADGGGELAPVVLTGPARCDDDPAIAAVLARFAASCRAAGVAQLFDASDAGLVLHWQGAACPEAPRQILGLPLRRPATGVPGAVLLLAVNPRKPLDAAGSAFFDSVAGHVVNALDALDAQAAARQRMQAMAELDRSKSQFFANASHELRTPLTLILGPLGALLEPGASTLPDDAREAVDMAHRNAQRLHKLVNSLMDFASIEAGRLPLLLEPVDPGAITAEIAALFRSSVEAAGLALSLHCPAPLGEILLDRDMWEKIVFNLLSNAYKFTLDGRIDILLERAAGALRLTVADTGIGIDPGDIGQVFERFYRSAAAAGRSAEGSGVGLALVQELVRLHGGQVAVESAPGAGARFTVTLPWRSAGAMRARPAVSAGPALRQRRAQFNDEIRRYGRVTPGPAPAAQPASAMRVVVVDDNPDVVRYIERLLHDSCTVVSAGDAAAGLAAVRSCSPDLVLVDVMLPGVDGLELVRQIRADKAIHTVSLVVLSARAGEEARLDALEAGADDYLVKPFSARELIARVRSHVQMARMRRTAIEQEGELLRQIAEVRHDLASVLEGTSEAFVSVDHALRLLGAKPTPRDAAGFAAGAAVFGRDLIEVSPEVGGGALEAALRETIAQGHPTSAEHYHAFNGRWYHVRCYPAAHGAIFFATDITTRKQTEQALVEAHAELERRVEQRTEELREANQLLAAVFDRAPGGIAITDLAGNVVRVNAAYAELTGYPAHELPLRAAAGRVDAADLARLRLWQARLQAGEFESFEIEMRYRRPDGREVWVSNFVSLIEHAWRGERYFVAIARDITERKRVDAERLAAQRELRVLYERLQTVRESERTALAREVHDQLGQILSAAKIDIKLLEDDLRAGAPLSREKIVAELGSASATLERGIGLVREIATELRAPELDEQGLYSAIAWHARDFEQRTRIVCEVAFDARRPQPPRPAAAALLRIFQEAMTNVLRHAQAGKVWVTLEQRGPSLQLRVRDDGTGIARGRLRAGGSLGLQGMRERADLVEGKLLVGPLSPRGTLVSVRVPLKPGAADHGTRKTTKGTH